MTNSNFGRFLDEEKQDIILFPLCYYAALLSERESTGPASAYDGGYASYRAGDEGYDIWNAMEAVVLSKPTHGKVLKSRAVAYAFVANVVSFIVGLWLAQQIPGIF